MGFEEIAIGPNWQLSLSREATTAIPYKAEKFEDGRENYGFRQLVGRVPLIDEIPEVQSFPPLAAVLEAINAQGSPYMSSACDFGIFPQHDGEREYFAAGGFAVLVFRDAARNRRIDEFLTVGQALGQVLEARSPHSYIFGVSPLKDFYGLEGYWCLRAQFAGLASEQTKAWEFGGEAATKLANAIRQTY